MLDGRYREINRNDDKQSLSSIQYPASDIKNKENQNK